MPFGAQRQANFLSPQIDYGGGMDDFWDQYRKNASNTSQVDFNKTKSSIMGPQWQRYLQMTYSPAKQENFRFNR